MIYKRSWETERFQKHLLYHCVALIIEYIVIVVSVKSTINNRFYHYSLPYLFLLFLLPLVASLYEKSKKKVGLYLKLISIISLFL